MTDEEIAAIKAREKAAWPWPWVIGTDENQTSGEILTWGSAKVIAESVWDDANAAFIVYARDDIPMLVADLEAWRALGRALLQTPAHTRHIFSPANPFESKPETFVEIDADIQAQARALLGMSEGEAQP